MPWTLALAFMALWLAGLLTSYDVGGFVHVFIVTATLVGIGRLIRDRRWT